MAKVTINSNAKYTPDDFRQAKWATSKDEQRYVNDLYYNGSAMVRLDDDGKKHYIDEDQWRSKD